MDAPFYAPTRTGSPFLVYHICKICRNPRSKAYHLRHPVDGDVMPEPTFCSACKANSAEVPVMQVPAGDSQQLVVRRHIPFRHVEAPISSAAVAPPSAQAFDHYLTQEHIQHEARPTPASTGVRGPPPEHDLQRVSTRRHIPFRHVEAPHTTAATAAAASTVTPQSSISQQSPSDDLSTASYREIYPALDSVALQRQCILKPRVNLESRKSLVSPPNYQPANAQVLTRTFREPPPQARKSVRVELPSAAHGPFHAEVSPTPSLEVLTTGSQVDDDGQEPRWPAQPGWLTVTKTKQYIDRRGRPFEVVKEDIVVEEGSTSRLWK